MIRTAMSVGTLAIIALTLAGAILVLRSLPRRASLSSERTLLHICQGDHAKLERLIAFERQQSPRAGRRALARRAVLRWKRDNRA
jgi:hypothetical protein